MNTPLEYILVGIVTLGIADLSFDCAPGAREILTFAYRLFSTQVRKNLCL